MGKRSVAFGLFICLAQLAGVASGAPVLYSFSTGANTFSPVPGLLGTKVFGSFEYDAAAPLTFTTGALQNPAGASIYGVVPTTGFPSSYMNLNAHLADGSIGPTDHVFFSDPRGSTTVSNDGLVSPPGAPAQDILSLDADPFGATGVHNISSLVFGDYRLWNMRLFWLESTLGGDFLSNQSLPGVLPSGPARLSLDFVPVNSTSGTPLSFVFYENVLVSVVPPPPGMPTSPIPEPETYAMLLAGLGFLVCHVRRRKKLQAV